MSPGPARKTTPIDAAAADPRFWGRRIQPLTIRLNHWMNVLFIVLMAGSGLQIFAAYPALGPRGAKYGWYPWQGVAPPSWLTIGGWLEGGRHWHFAIAWFLVLNGVVYLAYFFGRGEWRRRLFLPARDAGNAIRMSGYYLRVRKTPPPADFYNGLQRLTYSSVVIVIIAAGAVGTGYLQTGAAPLAIETVRWLRRGPRRPSVRAGFYSDVRRDSYRAGAAASARAVGDDHRRQAWLR